MGIYHDILKHYWGYEDFRPLQLDIIESVAAGNDTLGLMPTGGGKSLTFQVPALAKEGICIVVTPLVALMKDQVERLKSMGIKAACIHSALTFNEIVLVFDNCLYGNYKFLYISPERLSTPLFQERLLSLPVNLLVVDEAHCISQWGYDFRPSYLQIASIRSMLPNVPVLAVTATATPEVVDDIQQRLHFPKPNVFKARFERDNLAYVVRPTDDKNKQLLKCLQGVPGSAVVYVRIRRRTKEVADFLISKGISADYFHAGLSDESKNQKQAAWKTGKTRVMVATNAFGMGIDKADVRIVVHYDLPDSLEAYFQEAGRAGRDEKKAFAVLLFQKSDATLLKRRISDGFPDKQYIRKVYDALGNYNELGVGLGEDAVFPLDIEGLCHSFHLNPNQCHGAMKVLQQAGYIEFSDEQEGQSRVLFTMERDELYHLQTDEKSDKVLQTLLRSYAGFFADYVPIQEEVLAHRTGLTREEVYQELKKLSNNSVINYIPYKKTAFLRFVRERIPSNELRLSKEVYDERRNRFEDRILAMIDYASDSSICRSKRLMHYFGQYQTSNCGKCDVCLEKSQGQLRRYEVENITDAIRTKLTAQSLPLAELVDGLSYNEQKVIEVLRFLCQNKQVNVENGIYCLVN